MWKIALPLILLILPLSSGANIQRRMAIFTQQSDYYKQVCFGQDGTFLEDIVLFDPESSISETAFDCNAQAGALVTEADNIEREVQRLGGASCELEIIDPALIELLNGGTGIVDELNCPGSGSAAQCTSVVACNLVSSMIPFGAQAAQLAFRNHPTLGQCGASGTNCLNNLGAAIGHNLLDTLTGLCWLVTFGHACNGEDQPDVDASRAPASGDPDGDARLRGIAQGSQNDAQVASFSEDPLGWLSNMASSFQAMIADSISNRYGCQQWSGLPFVSDCVMPMEWDCANCDQKLNMICGVTGYIGTEVLVTFFTAGAAGAVKGLSTSLRGIRSVSQVENYIAGTRAARLAGRAGSAVGRGLGAVWQGISQSRVVQGIRGVTRRISVNARLVNRRAARSVRVYGQGQRFMITAAKRYNELAESAFNFGYQATGGASRAASARLAREYPLLSDITSGRYTNVRTPQDYLRVAIPANRRANYRVNVTTDRPPRVVISDVRSTQLESSLRFDFNPQAAAPRPRVEPPPPVSRAPAARTVDVPEVPEPTVITVTGTRNFDDYPELPVSTRSNDDVIRGLGGDSAYNRELSRLARDEYRLPGNFEGASFDLHDAWMAANPQLRASRPDLFVDFDDLPLAQKNVYADELERAFRQSNPEIIDSRAYQEFRSALGSPSSTPGPAALVVRAEDSVVTGGAGLIARSSADDPLRVVVGPRLDGARDATRVTDITSGQVRTGSAGEEAIRRFGGDNVSFQDRELILDVLLGGPRKSTYTRNPALSSRYAEFESRILRDPELPRLRADVEELAADRVAVGNRLADEEVADLSRNGIRADISSINCSAFSNVTPGAFPASGRCRRVKFDQDVNGRYCSCGAMNKTSFTWLVRCPTSGREFRSLSTYVDELALPSGSAPEMCTRVDIPRGKECYVGPTSATFAGLGGAMQMLCEHRPPRDPRARATPDRPATADDIAAYNQQLEDIRSFGLDFGGQSVSPVRWSPFSTFTEFQGIIDRAARACPRICPPDEMQRILREFDSAKSAIRSRGSADDLARLEIEERDFAQYIQELQNGRRSFPGSDTRIPSAPRSSRRTREILSPEEMTAAGAMADGPRLRRARAVIGDVSEAQEAAILRAHQVGEEFGIGNYPPRVLSEKARILEEAGISLDDRRKLFENGVVGGNRSVDPSLSASDLRSEGLSLNNQAQNNYRLAGRETDVARRSELLRAYQSDRRLAGQNFEQSAITDGDGPFSQAIGNRTNAALAYAAGGDVDSLVRVLSGDVMRGTAQTNLRRAREAVPSDPADPFYATLRVEADTWAAAVSRLEARRPAGASATPTPGPRPSSETPPPASARRADAQATSSPDTPAPPITPDFIRSLSKEDALSRGQAAASAGRHDEAALLFRRASNSERLSDPNYLRAFNESLKGDSSLALAHLQRAQRNQTSAIAFITELKNYSMIETMLPRQKENLRAILTALSQNSMAVPRTGPYRDWIAQMLNRLPARPLPTRPLTPVSPRGAPSTAISTNRTRPLLTAPERRVAGARTDADRITEARDLVGTVTPAQEAAIIRAHNLGSEYRIGTYPRRILQQKGRILEEAGFNLKQRRSLMENGIVGGNGPVGRVDPAKAILAPVARTDRPPELAPVDMTEVERFRNSRHYREVTLRRARENKEARDAGRAGQGEYTVHASDFESARNMMLELPVLQELGYGRPNIGEWRIFQSNLPRSALYGRMVGYQRRLPNGNLATVRLDWDETKGAHYNIEIEGPDANLKTVEYNLAVTFRCGGVPCTEAEVYELQNRMIIP